MYDDLLAKSFSKHERKKLGYGAFFGCLLIALSFYTVFKPYWGPLPACMSFILTLTNLIFTTQNYFDDFIKSILVLCFEESIFYILCLFRILSCNALQWTWSCLWLLVLKRWWSEIQAAPTRHLWLHWLTYQKQIQAALRKQLKVNFDQSWQAKAWVIKNNEFNHLTVIF